MVKVTVDFSEVEEFEPLDKGEYEAMIEKVEYREATSDDKYDYLNVEFTITESGHEGRKAWKIWSLSPKALWRMKQDFENLELPQDEIEIDYDEDTMLVTEPELQGMPVIIALTTRTYEGRLQNDVQAVLPRDGAVKKGKKAAPAKGKKKAEAGSKRRFK